MGQGARAMAVGAGWRAVVARLLSVAVLLAALLAPSFTETAGACAALSVSAAMPLSDADGDTPDQRDGMAHAGAHCACHLADRVEAREQPVPAASGRAEHPARATRAYTSRDADPPSRPPQA